jgi:3-methyladenine DNA glycosylase AlkD
MSLKNIITELKKAADPKKAKFLQGYFKTGKGDYGAGDIFLGITVPMQRKIAHRYVDLNFEDIKKLLAGKIHEYRFTALEILVAKFHKAKKSSDEKVQKAIFSFYLKNKKYVNNWDLVDTSSRYILGEYLIDKNKDILYTLARSKNIWDRRIAITTTYYFITQYEYTVTLKISEILLQDTHDLIHKATGWMLREVGDRSIATEERFLRKYYKKMPRTMLRYAIEKFPEKKRLLYLRKSN